MEALQQVTVAPETDPDTEWWWAALAGGRLMLPYCTSCDRHFFPPLPACSTCGGDAVERREASGAGTVYSWIVVHHALDPAFVAEVPYTVVAVHLAEGPRLFGRIANGPLTDGMPVLASTYTVGETTLLGFQRSESPAPASGDEAAGL